MGFFLDKGVVAVGRWLYHRLPLTEAAGYGLKSFLYQRFDFLFKNTVSYRIWRNARDDVRQLSSLVTRLSEYTHAIDPDEIILFSQNPVPLISIIVPLFHRPEILLPCLKSLSRACVGHPSEVLVLNPLPEVESQALLSRIDGVRVVSVGAGKSMAAMWNMGAGVARGRYVAFLAAGLMPLPDWLDEQVQIFREHPDAGLVGSQISMPDGKIWESGGYFDEGGAFRRLGEGANSFHPEFSFLREVDFCSASACMVPLNLFEQIGGFAGKTGDDSVQAGADISAAIRSAGRKVFTHPLSKVVILSKSDENPWMSIDSGRRAVPQSFDHNRDRQAHFRINNVVPTGNILFIDVRTPTPDQDSGSQDIVSYFNIFLSMGFESTFIPGADLQFMEKYTPDLQRMGVRCLYTPFVPGIAGYLESHGPEYDVVLLYKVHCAAFCIDMVHRFCPRARIVFNTVDLHFVREQRQAAIEGSDGLLKTAENTRLLELSIIQKADCTIVLSTEEREILLKEFPVSDKKIAVIPLIRDIPGRSRPFFARKNMLFVGGFEHRPNVDAMIYFVRTVWPLIRKDIPGAVFYIVGSKPPQEILDMASADVIVTGYLPDISPYFHECRLSVAPIRYGAGLKGKIATSLGYGLPCVASSIAVEGTGLEPEKDILVADTPEAFAAAVLRLYQDETIWNTLSDSGIDFIDRHFSFAAGRQRIESLLRELAVWRG